MRELSNETRVHGLGLSLSSDRDLPLPWMEQTSRGFLREPSRSRPDTVTTVTGYRRFNGKKGTEDKALRAAVQQVDKSIPISTHHAGDYTFVNAPHEKAKRICAVLESWDYSSKNVVDSFHEALVG